MMIPDFKFDAADSRHPLYHTWWHILARCYIPFCPQYSDYNGRGISVCERWHEFKNFAADMGDRPEGMSVDRIDNDRGYSPDNCKWASRIQQAMNRRPFKNNTSGLTGVRKVGARYSAVFDYDGRRYAIGRFDTASEAASARLDFVEGFMLDRASALASISEPTIWATSSTRIRGVTPHKDGGYVVRSTRGGVRHYVGYFKTLEDAENAKREFDSSRD